MCGRAAFPGDHTPLGRSSAVPSWSACVSRNRQRILVVESDGIAAEAVTEFLRGEGYETGRAGTCAEALAELERRPHQVVISDVDLPRASGFELLRSVRERFPGTVVIMTTGYGTIEGAVEAIRMGAYDYLTKPVLDEELKLVVERACQQQLLLSENQHLREALDERFGLGHIIGRDYKMVRTFELIEMVADTPTTVLIQGESGTGKSIIARAIHQRSGRQSGPFVEVSCGALPESLLESELFGHVRGAFTGAVADKQGRFKAAHGGTIFLDEISSATPALQVRLLRVLQERQFEPVGSNRTEKVDVRVLLASNEQLSAAVEAGRFRRDLYYRIAVVTVQLPRLAERIGDIPLLAEHFLAHYSEQLRRRISGFDPRAMEHLQRYAWPGNVRELENVVERAVVLCRNGFVGVQDLPEHLLEPEQHEEAACPWRPMALQQALAEPEKRIITQALKANHYNRQATARALGINRTTLYKKMKHYGLLAIMEPVSI